MPSNDKCESCGGNLSRYNNSDRCGPCQRRAAMRPAAGPSNVAVIPSHVWDQLDVRTALDTLDFAALFTSLRAHAQIGQAELGRVVGKTQAELSSIESGRRRIVNIDAIVSVLTSLGVPAGLVRFPLPESNDSAARRAAAHQVAARQSGVQQAAMDSVAFINSLSPPSATDALLDEFAFELSRIATAYVHAPLWPLFLDLVRIRDQLFGLLGQRQRHWHTRRLFLLAGVCCLLLAHASQNLGREAAAHGQIKTAMICADEAGHEGLRAWGRGTSALIAEWSPQRHLALRFTADAHDFAPAGEARIRIAAIEARTAARIGNTARAHAALDRMHEAQEHSDSDDGLGAHFGGLLTFPAPKQDYYAGGTYALLGEHAKALEHATRAICQYETGLPEDRSYGDEALARLDIVTAHLAMGDLDDAAHHLMTVLAIPPEQRISQLGSGLQRVRLMLQAPAVAAASPVVADLLEATRRFQAALSAGTVPSVP